MVKFVIRKDVYEELIEKGFGKKDMSKLTKKQITDKNGHTRNVWVRMGEEPKEERKGKQEVEEVKAKRSSSTDVTSNYSVGQEVSFEYGGNTLKGTITARGQAGVTIRDEKNNQYKVEYNKINSVKDTKNVDILLDKSFVQQGWRDGSDGLQPKSFDTIEGLYKGVEAVQQEFSNLSDSVKAQFKELNPLLLKRTSLKGVDRVKEKLREDQKEVEKKKKIGIKEEDVYDEKTDTYHCRTIRDCDGHTFCMKSLEDVSKLMQFYNKQDYVVRMKNNFAKPSPVGYSDINMNIKLSNGAIVEMQLNTTANMVAKERYGHSLYEVFRSIKGNPKYKELENLMSDAQKSLYGLANRYSKDGNYPEVPGGNIFDKNYKHEPYAKTIENYVKKSLPLFEKAKKDGVLNKKTIEHFEHLVEYIK